MPSRAWTRAFGFILKNSLFRSGIACVCVCTKNAKLYKTISHFCMLRQFNDNDCDINKQMVHIKNVFCIAFCSSSFVCRQFQTHKIARKIPHFSDSRYSVFDMHKVKQRNILFNWNGDETNFQEVLHNIVSGAALLRDLIFNFNNNEIQNISIARAFIRTANRTMRVSIIAPKWKHKQWLQQQQQQRAWT